MKVTVGVGTRHICLSEADVKLLFGPDYSLTVFRRLAHDKSFMANETVKLKTSMGEIPDVRVLGPARTYTQATILKSDDFLLRCYPPVRDDGDLEDNTEVTIIGPLGTITRPCARLMMRHVHMNPKDSFKFGFYDNEIVRAKITSDKGAYLENVKIKIGVESHLELHIDVDDANACLIESGATAKIIKKK